MLTKSLAAVRRDRQAERRRVVAIQFIEGNLHRFADFRAEYGERIAEHPAVLHMGQRNQVLRP